jgi:hypothetical protein
MERRHLGFLRRLILSAPVLMSVGGTALAKDGCDDYLGNWYWFTGTIVTFTADHRISSGGRPVGTWECSEPQKHAATLRWDSHFIDHVTLTRDQISGVNQAGYKVWANRSNPETAATAPRLPKPAPAPLAPATASAPSGGCQGGNWREQCEQELRRDPIAGPFPSQGAIANCVQQKMAACGNLVP